MADPSVLQDIEKKRNCSLQYCIHLRQLWRSFPLLLTAVQLYQPKCMLGFLSIVSMVWELVAAMGMQIHGKGFGKVRKQSTESKSEAHPEFN